MGRPNLPWRLDGKPPTAMWVRTDAEDRLLGLRAQGLEFFQQPGHNLDRVSLLVDELVEEGGLVFKLRAIAASLAINT